MYYSICFICATLRHIFIITVNLGLIKIKDLFTILICCSSRCSFKTHKFVSSFANHSLVAFMHYLGYYSRFVSPCSRPAFIINIWFHFLVVVLATGVFLSCCCLIIISEAATSPLLTVLILISLSLAAAFSAAARRFCCFVIFLKLLVLLSAAEVC